jgi:hypothetical protein
VEVCAWEASKLRLICDYSIYNDLESVRVIIDRWVNKDLGLLSGLGAQETSGSQRVTLTRGDQSR